MYICVSFFFSSFLAIYIFLINYSKPGDFFLSLFRLLPPPPPPLLHCFIVVIGKYACEKGKKKHINSNQSGFNFVFF